MATIPSNFVRFQPSLPTTRLQPGNLVTKVTPLRQPTLRGSSLFALPKEPEDARLTGGTRSLDRRLLALNLAGSFAKPRAVRSAALPLRAAVA
jgi:hypothetical protein